MNGKMYNKILSTVGVICILLLLMLGFYNAIKDYNSLVEHGEYTIEKHKIFQNGLTRSKLQKIITLFIPKLIPN